MTKSTGARPAGRLAVRTMMAECLQLLRQPVYLVGQRGAVALGGAPAGPRAQARAVDVAARGRVRGDGRAGRRRRQHRHLLRAHKDWLVSFWVCPVRVVWFVKILSHSGGFFGFFVIFLLCSLR